MKIKFIIFLIFPFYSFSQNIVVHKDLLEQMAKNDAFKTASLLNYSAGLSKIQTRKETVAAAAASMEIVQQKVFNSLTNVDAGLKNVKTLFYISKYTTSILKNAQNAITIAAGKPYLVSIASKQAIIIYERVGGLTSFVSDFIMTSNESQLIKPTERDRLLYTVYRQLIVLNSLTQDLCDKMSKWRVQDAVNNIIPINQYINTDKKIINNIFNTWSY